MVIRRSHFVSICLLALASSIALTEYLMYSPRVLPDSVDDGLLQDLGDESQEPLVESDEVVEEQVPSKDSDVSNVVVENVSEPAKVSSEEKGPFSDGNEKKCTINKGDTIASILAGLGFDKTEIHGASKALSKVFNLKNLKIGQEIVVRAKKSASGEISLDAIEIKPDVRFRVIVSANGKGGFSAEKVDVPIKKVMRNVSGVISPKDPAGSLKSCGVKRQVAVDALRAIAQVANVRSSKTPVNFEFLYRDFYDENGNCIGRPDLVYASILLNGRIFRVYKFDSAGASEYVDSNGVLLKSIAKSRSMLMQPINSMKITSKFGVRVHPISGKVKGHTGIDLSANVGTPVRAAASGVVTRASHYAGYGRYISIRHSTEIATAYGHLSRIAVRGGQHVAQGQIIGYTGNSGYSTGPHLHYEVLKGGRPINPLSFVKQEPQKLSGRSLVKFNSFKREVNLQVVGLSQDGLTNNGKRSIGKIRKIS